jgi:hypothetical protein
MTIEVIWEDEVVVDDDDDACRMTRMDDVGNIIFKKKR